MEIAPRQWWWAYSASGQAARKNLPPIAEPGGQLGSVRAVAKWYEILTMPGVAIGGGNPFLDPGAYRAPMIFQLAAAYYKAPNLYNNMLQHVVVPEAQLFPISFSGSKLDFQFTYEHSAPSDQPAPIRIIATVNLPKKKKKKSTINNLSDPAKDARITGRTRVVVLPGLGTPRSARDHSGSRRPPRVGYRLD